MNPFQEGADYLDKLIADRDRWKALAERMAEALNKIDMANAPSVNHLIAIKARSDWEAAQK